MSSSAPAAAGTDPAADLIQLYDRAMPQVYGYLVRRCDNTALAEDLTAEVFLAAADALLGGSTEQIGVGWLIGAARHKLIDHWRRRERHERALTLIHNESRSLPTSNDDPLSGADAREVLAMLTADHRSALALRYVDGLTVPDVADALGRSVHATESLLQRAKAAYRDAATQRDAERGDDHD